VGPYTVAGSQTRSKQWAVFGGDPFPQYAQNTLGTTVVADGRAYTDWIAGLGAIGLGYRYAPVEAAVQKQLTRGVTFPLPTRLEEEVAESLCVALGWPEQVRWVKTGSEATAAAMMIARRATGRRKIISMGYHGWHECHQPGPDLIDAPKWYVLEREIDCQTAAVLLEPTRNVQDPHLGFHLGTIQATCRATGALLIMDEMVTGFRWALGGISESCKIVPDLACFGKALGNGYPIACVVGSRRLMKHAVDVSSTFGGECVGLAAAQAVLEVYRKEPVIQTLWTLGGRLLKACPALTGWPVHPVYTVGADYTTSERAIPLVQAVAQRGHLTHPSGFNIMYMHTEQDVEALANAINAGL
jgi:glutamate-1-semialdehyde 2,1-aminomutase